MRLAIRHVTTYRYEPAAASLALRLRLFASSSPLQTVERWQVTVNGEPVEPMLTNGFGDSEGLWFARREIETAEIVAEGTVQTTDAAGVLGRRPGASAAVFLRTTPLTGSDDSVAEIAASIEGATPLDRLHSLMSTVHETLEYRPGVTDSTTTAAQAATMGAGVCQDFAHVFIAAARSIGVPARYVIGYLLDEEAPLSETHAWVEAHVDGLGWIGFDPLHKLCPTDQYVRLVSGFDAHDAAPIRGTLPPGSTESLDVEVAISQGQRQSQQ